MNFFSYSLVGTGGISSSQPIKIYNLNYKMKQNKNLTKNINVTFIDSECQKRKFPVGLQKALQKKTG
jgi:hypothetical protein